MPEDTPIDAWAVPVNPKTGPGRVQASLTVSPSQTFAGSPQVKITVSGADGTHYDDLDLELEEARKLADQIIRSAATAEEAWLNR